MPNRFNNCYSSLKSIASKRQFPFQKSQLPFISMVKRSWRVSGVPHAALVSLTHLTGCGHGWPGSTGLMASGA